VLLAFSSIREGAIPHRLRLISFRSHNDRYAEFLSQEQRDTENREGIHAAPGLTTSCYTADLLFLFQAICSEEFFLPQKKQENGK
jgi:hypothetical protein